MKRKYHNIAVREEVFEAIRQEAHRRHVPIGHAVKSMMMRKFRLEINALIFGKPKAAK